MAKIEDLVGEIADARLREEVAREVAALKKQKKFGLVFEEHIPETIQLPNLPPKVGSRVVKREGNSKDTYVVEKILSAGKSHIRHENGNSVVETAMIKDLVTVKRFGEPIYPSLIPVARLTCSENKPYHVIINADNFHSLQLLLYSCTGQVDVIYIDPPYNTGARDWKYNNDYVDENDQWRHSKWLSMMKKRLILSKRLLKRDGILICTIDEAECHNLGVLLNEIFNNQNLGEVTIVINPSGQETKRKIASSAEFAFFYGSSEMAQIERRPMTDEELLEFDQSDDKGPYKTRELRRTGSKSEKDYPGNKGLWYPLWIKGVPTEPGEYDLSEKICLSTDAIKGADEMWPIDPGGVERVWRVGIVTLNDHLEDGNVRIKRTREGRLEPMLKQRPKPRIITSVWDDSSYYSANGKRILKKILGTDNFNYPKSPYSVAECIQSASRKKDILILDFFAGSGTTYHAAALLNAADGGNRRCILVTNSEVNEKLAKQLNGEGLFEGDPDFEKHGICESVTWPRCKYVTQGYRDDGTRLPGKYPDGRQMKDGFQENLEYLRLEFLDPDEVAYGDKFEAILPILWLMAGAKGERETARGYGKWFIPKNSPYAVLIKEDAFADFKRMLADRPDIKQVFLVTDSEEAFHEMSADLPGRPQTKMLYKSYLDNFQINTEKNV